MAENIDGLILNQVLSLLLKKIVVPSDFHGRVQSVKEMLEDDVSGLVDSLTDFAVTTASVDFSVETDSSELTKILKKWLDNINSPYKGQIPRGIKPLAEEYFKERWKSSSFPILKIAEWGTVNGISVPTKMFFVDGGSVYSKEIDKNKEIKELVGYKYYLGKDKKKEDALNKGVIITRPYGRWFDEYPNPYLIKRGVYHNWKIIQSLKDIENKILNQIIPYIFLVKKGTEGLATAGVKTYSNPELKQTMEDFQKLVNKMQSTYTSSLEKTKTPIRVTQFDEEIEHFIPNLATIFAPALFTVAEKSILSGLGFIDIAEAVSTSRRESILNPKAFIEETKKGIEDFKKILNELVARIIEENKTHKKYMNTTFYITSPPVKGFMTDDFKNQLRLLWKNGQLSNQTYCEMVGEVEFKTEVARREKEAKDGTEITMYPHQTQNLEKDESFEEIKRQQKFYPEEKEDKNGKPLSPDKTEPEEKEEYDIGGLESPVKCSYCGHIFDFLAESEAGMGYVKCPKCDETVTQKDLIGNLTLEEAFKPEVTENYIRLRQRDPVDFQQKSFRIITLSKSKGIKAVIGRLKGKTTTTVQSYLFDKKKWSTKEAQAWVEKQKASDLETAPYTKISELPASIRKVLSPSLQRVFIRVFNSAYDKYHNESRAFRIAWGVIKKLAYKGKDGKWYRKTTKGKKVRLTKSMIEEIEKNIEE